jgi:hypothetical protein
VQIYFLRLYRGCLRTAPWKLTTCYAIGPRLNSLALSTCASCLGHLPQSIGTASSKGVTSAFPSLEQSPFSKSQYCYRNLDPGGWIEQLELDAHIESDDNSNGEIPPLAVQSDLVAGSTPSTPCAPLLRKLDLFRFTRRPNKWPIGPWARDTDLKEAGRLNHHMWSSGLEG